MCVEGGGGVEGGEEDDDDDGGGALEKNRNWTSCGAAEAQVCCSNALIALGCSSREGRAAACRRKRMLAIELIEMKPGASISQIMMGIYFHVFIKWFDRVLEFLCVEKVVEKWLAETDSD